MINDLYTVLKGFDRTAGLNRSTKREVFVKSEIHDIVEDVLTTWNEVGKMIEEAEEMKASYKGTTDKKMEDNIAADLGALNAKINTKFAHCNNEIDKIRKEVNEEMRGDPDCEEPTLRMRNMISKALQAKVYHLIKRSQKTQLEVKITIQEKIARQLSTYDNTLNQEQIQNLIRDPQKVEEIVKERMYAGTNPRIQSAIDSIKEKLQEINELEKNVLFLFRMIEDLALIIKAQTDLVNSIEANMKAVKDSIDRGIKDFEKAQSNFMSAQQKFCGIFVAILIIMIIVINYAMGQLGLI